MVGALHKENKVSKKRVAFILVLIFFVVPSTLNLEHRMSASPIAPCRG